MVVVYLKNGEKAPLLDANYVKIEAGNDSSGGEQKQRCFWGNTEVGQFKWSEVAGYTVSSIAHSDAPYASNDAWVQHLQG
ncbi:MAG TPA: hypothetical protein VFY10_09965 [Dehalococcoidia bacterium]|nr:hypothetical protein [Dehalococcoidia bacterium]